MLERLFETIGSLGGAWAYASVGLLAAGESSLGVGLVVPGETGMIVGGFIVSQGNADFGVMLLVAIAGAIIGDSLGYEIGRRLGPAIRRTWLGEKIGQERWARAQEYLSERGGRAVFVGRFVAVVRSLVPALAGVSHMRYRKFLLWNALGGVVWATIYVSIGYFAGRSYERFADAAEGAGFVLLALAVLIAAITVAARWMARHPERVQGWGEAIRTWRPVAFVQRNFSGPLRFAQRRFRLDDAFGLSLTVGLIVLILAGWALAAVTSDVSGRWGLVEVDLPAARWFAENRADRVTSVMRWISDLGDAIFLAALLAAVALAWLYRTRRWSVALFLLVALVGGALLTDVLKDLVERPRPPERFAIAETSGSAFPSGHTTQATVAFGALAYLHGAVVRAWSARVAIWAAAVMVMMLVGFSRTYLGVHWLSDVAGAYALGAAWLAIVVTAFSASTRLRRQHTSVSGE